MCRLLCSQFVRHPAGELSLDAEFAVKGGAAICDHWLCDVAMRSSSVLPAWYFVGLPTERTTLPKAGIYRPSRGHVWIIGGVAFPIKSCHVVANTEPRMRKSCRGPEEAHLLRPTMFAAETSGTRLSTRPEAGIARICRPAARHAEPPSFGPCSRPLGAFPIRHLHCVAHMHVWMDA